MSNANRLTDNLVFLMAKAILTNEWPVNSRLPDSKTLCSQHDVSRTVLREAMRIIGAKGMIIARPRIGTQIAERENWAFWDAQLLNWLKMLDLLPDYAHDLNDMRFALEPAMAALAASRAQANGIATLQNALRVLQSTPSNNNEKAFLGCIYKLSGNVFATGAAQLAFASLGNRPIEKTPLADYSALVAAISQNQPSQARQAAINALLG